MTIDAMADAAERLCPGRPIDLGIVRAVVVLDAAGVETFESREGGAGHSYPEPTVRWHGTPADGWRALGVLMTYGLPVRRLSRTWTFDNHGVEKDPDGPYWEATFYERLT